MRLFVAVALALSLAPRVVAQDAFPPVVFVHGNGDDASKWVPVIWLFESNGYPANRLFSIRFTDPAGRADDTKPEPFALPPLTRPVSSAHL